MNQPTRVIIRAATSSDRDHVCAIAAAAMHAYGLVADFDGLDRDLGCLGEPDDGRITALVAECEGNVLGSLVLSVRDAKTAKLSGFYLDSNARGRGIGRAMLTEAISICRASGYQCIYLETWEKMSAAVGLYLALGWKRRGRLAFSSGAEWAYELKL